MIILNTTFFPRMKEIGAVAEAPKKFWASTTGGRLVQVQGGMYRRKPSTGGVYSRKDRPSQKVKGVDVASAKDDFTSFDLVSCHQ